MWQPLSQLPGIAAARRDGRRVAAVARLKDGVERPQAQAEFETIARRIADQYPETNAGTSAAIVRLREQ